MLFLPINSVKANEDIIETQYEIIENYEFDSFIQELNSNYKDYIPQYSFRDLINTLRGEEHYDLRSLSRGIITFFFREISTNYHLLGQLIILSIICAVLKNVQGAFENNNIGKITYSVTYLVLIIIAIQSFEIALSVGREAIDNMVSFIQALMPVVIALLASIGGITSAAVFNPIIFMGVSVASTWIRNILLPIIFFAAVLGLISNISDRFHVSALSSFIKQVCIFLLGLFLSVFLGLLVVQGAATSTVDGISVRTAKFASKNFIPIVGGIFSDTVDTIVGCSLILKNAIGLAGLLIVFLTTLFPIIKILAMVFVYKFAGAVIQPLGEESVVKCLNDMANHLVFIVITVSSVALMFFVGITVIIASGNITVMMR
ncbi:MAG TPA: stage III sporulation protein AE [Thermoanaerobacterales bacterium]|nr:stage III sporulation protein AE [Thermoanaerobacterales bacterium]